MLQKMTDNSTWTNRVFCIYAGGKPATAGRSNDASQNCHTTANAKKWPIIADLASEPREPWGGWPILAKRGWGVGEGSHASA
jgi:hypothetical protein